MSAEAEAAPAPEPPCRVGKPDVWDFCYYVGAHAELRYHSGVDADGYRYKALGCVYQGRVRLHMAPGVLTSLVHFHSHDLGIFDVRALWMAVCGKGAANMCCLAQLVPDPPLCPLPSRGVFQ